jgi:hypothetical protein
VSTPAPFFFAIPSQKHNFFEQSAIVFRLSINSKKIAKLIMATAPTAICSEVSLRLQENDDGVKNPFAGTPAVYTTPAHVAWTRAISTRLGRDTTYANVTVLLEDDSTDEEKVEYIKGILIAAIIIFCFFTVWMLVILILKCCGYQRVGFFSGQRIRRPLPPTPPVLQASDSFTTLKNDEKQLNSVTESQKAKRILAALQEQEEQSQLAAVATTEVVEYRKVVEEWQMQVKRAETVQRRIRIVVIFCCLAVVTSAILMLIYGVGALQTSVNDVQDGLQQTSSLATSGIALVDRFLVAQDDAVNVTEFVLSSVNTICPAVQETICRDVWQQTDCNWTGIPLQDEIQQVLQVFDDILIPTAAGEEVEDTLHQAKDTLNQVQDGLDQVNQVLDTVKYDLFQALQGAKNELQKVVVESEQMQQQVASFDWAFDVAAAFAICLAVLSIFIIIGVVLAWRNQLNGSCFRWIRNLVIVPIFALLVVMSLIFSCVFVVGSITTADVCYESPDAIVLQALETNLFPDLEKSNKEFGPILVKFIKFYVQACPETVVPLDIDEMLKSKLSYVNDVVTPLQSVLASEDFTTVCGSNGDLTSGVQVMLEIMCVVSHLVLDLRNLLNCNNGNRVYTVRAAHAHIWRIILHSG